MKLIKNIKFLHLGDIVLLFVLNDVSLERLDSLIKSFWILFAASIGYFGSAFERFLKLGYTLFLIFEIFSVVNICSILDPALTIIQIISEDAFLLDPAPEKILLNKAVLFIQIYPMQNPLGELTHLFIKIK